MDTSINLSPPDLVLLGVKTAASIKQDDPMMLKVFEALTTLTRQLEDLGSALAKADVQNEDSFALILHMFQRSSDDIKTLKKRVDGSANNASAGTEVVSDAVHMLCDKVEKMDAKFGELSTACSQDKNKELDEMTGKNIVAALLGVAGRMDKIESRLSAIETNQKHGGRHRSISPPRSNMLREVNQNRKEPFITIKAADMSQIKCAPATATPKTEAKMMVAPASLDKKSAASTGLYPPPYTSPYRSFSPILKDLNNARAQERETKHHNTPEKSNTENIPIEKTTAAAAGTQKHSTAPITLSTATLSKAAVAPFKPDSSTNASFMFGAFASAFAPSRSTSPLKPYAPSPSPVTTANFLAAFNDKSNGNYPTYTFGQQDSAFPSLFTPHQSPTRTPARSPVRPNNSANGTIR